MASLGNVVTIGATTDKGILMSPAESVIDGVAVVTDWMLELPSAVWPFVAEGVAVFVDGQEFVSREESRPGTDQATTFVPLTLSQGGGPPVEVEGCDIVIDGDRV